MKAIIFAAGIGSRMGTITQSKPKALVEVGGLTLLEFSIHKLIRHGIDEIIINVHHFADAIEKFLQENENFGIPIEISDEREKLLETGGGLLKASWFFDRNEPFVTCNVDVLTDLDISSLINFHKRSDKLVTVAGKLRKTERYLLADQDNQLCGWENVTTGEKINSFKGKGKTERVGYSCITVMDPAIFKEVTETGAFSLIPFFLRLAEEQKVMIYRHDKDYWTDIGNPERLADAREYFSAHDIQSLL